MNYRHSYRYSFAKLFVLFLLVAAMLTACVHKNTPEPTEPKPPTEVNMELAQDYYDQGLQFYADEQYAKAKNAWLRVIKIAPDTRLAGRARAYIKKVDRILKTLKELEKKK